MWGSPSAFCRKGNRHREGPQCTSSPCLLSKTGMGCLLLTPPQGWGRACLQPHSTGLTVPCPGALPLVPASRDQAAGLGCPNPPGLLGRGHGHRNVVGRKGKPGGAARPPPAGPPHPAPILGRGSRALPPALSTVWPQVASGRACPCRGPAHVCSACGHMWLPETPPPRLPRLRPSGRGTRRACQGGGRRPWLSCWRSQEFAPNVNSELF